MLPTQFLQVYTAKNVLVQNLFSIPTRKCHGERVMYQWASSCSKEKAGLEVMQTLPTAQVVFRSMHSQMQSGGQPYPNYKYVEALHMQCLMYAHWNYLAVVDHVMQLQMVIPGWSRRL